MMRRMGAILFLFLMGAMGGVRAQGGADDAAIKKPLDDFLAAWNKHDAKAMAAVFAEDGDLIQPFGRTAKSRAEAETLFQEEQTGGAKESTYAKGEVSVRRVGEDVAIADWDGSITGMKTPDGTATPPFQHHVTAVLKSQGGQWWILSVRAFAFLPAPMSPGK